jgi:hypothetical protein
MTPEQREKDARDFMGAYFAMGPGSSVTSHPPHSQSPRFLECERRGWVTVEWRKGATAEILATEEGRKVAKNEWERLVKERFAALGADPEDFPNAGA